MSSSSFLSPFNAFLATAVSAILLTLISTFAFSMILITILAFVHAFSHIPIPVLMIQFVSLMHSLITTTVSFVLIAVVVIVNIIVTLLNAVQLLHIAFNEQTVREQVVQINATIIIQLFAPIYTLI